MAVLIAVLVSFLVAAVVLVLAGAARRSDAGGEARVGPWRAFRAGWNARRHPDPEQREAAAAAAVEPVDVSLDEFLRATTDEGAAYLQVDDLAATLERAARTARQQTRRRGA